MSDILLPTVQELEFSNDIIFWTEGAATTRRTFLMPLSNPLEFMAFGVLGVSHQLHFVAHGRVREDAGAFIDRMKQDGASVELYAQAPLSEDILRHYGVGQPYETQVLLPPPDPNGPSRPEDILASLWREGDATTRRALLMPLSNPAEFLAFGMLSPSDTPHFVARGQVRDDLRAFIDRMVRDGAKVELYARAPLPEEVLSKYTSDPSLAVAPTLIGWPTGGEARLEALRA